MPENFNQGVRIDIQSVEKYLVRDRKLAGENGRMLKTNILTGG